MWTTFIEFFTVCRLLFFPVVFFLWKMSARREKIYKFQDSFFFCILFFVFVYFRINNDAVSIQQIFKVWRSDNKQSEWDRFKDFWIRKWGKMQKQCLSSGWWIRSHVCRLFSQFPVCPPSHLVHYLSRVAHHL